MAENTDGHGTVEKMHAAQLGSDGDRTINYLIIYLFFPGKAGGLYRFIAGAVFGECP
jgi:hypothetical protein